MAAPPFQPDMLALLHHQHRYYTAQLGQTHQSLSKLYKKLFKTERALAEWKERELTRKDKKKLQWERGSTKSTVRSLELQQASLHDYIRQCDDLINSYSATGYSTPGTLWTGSMSPMAYPFTPSTPMLFTPWTTGPVEEAFSDPATPAPQYWDLSMLRERHPSSINAAADSGFHEPKMRGILFSYGESHDRAHVYSHERISASATMDMPPLSKKSLLSEKNKVPELVTPVSTGAEQLLRPHRRHYSENAIQLVEKRLGVFKEEVRVGSVPPLLKRAVSAGPEEGSDQEMATGECAG